MNESDLSGSLLTARQRRKQDESDDALFYAEPRFVHHLDAGFRQRLTALYRERLPEGGVLLDLMGSWVSHLPESGRYGEVIGHGLNAAELAANPRLDRHWVQNLNVNQTLPVASASLDAVTIVAGWQYLQQPEAIARELARLMRPGGVLIVAFSNRMFASKAPAIWLDSSDRGRLSLVGELLNLAGWQIERVIAEDTPASGPLGWLGGKGDPFFAVVATIS